METAVIFERVQERIVETQLLVTRLHGKFVGSTAKTDSNAEDVGWFSIDELDGLLLQPGVRELVTETLSLPRG